MKACLGLFGALALLCALLCAPSAALAQQAQPLSACGSITYTANGEPRPITQTTDGRQCSSVVGTVTSNAPAVTPAAGTAHIVVTGGTAVTMVTGPVNGCYITNPATAADENIAVAETAYVNIVTTATTTALNGTSTPIAPGASFYCPSGMTTNASVNALTSSHNLTVVKW